MEANDTELVSQEVCGKGVILYFIFIDLKAAKYIKFQLPELNLFLRKFQEEEAREEGKIRRK